MDAVLSIMIAILLAPTNGLNIDLTVIPGNGASCPSKEASAMTRRIISARVTQLIESGIHGDTYSKSMAYCIGEWGWVGGLVCA